MKKADSEYLRDWYSFFTIDYEHVVEQLFMCRFWLITSVLANLALIAVIIVLCFFMQSCAVSIAGFQCKQTIHLTADNEHISKRSATNFGHMAATGLDCII
jgi:hypothetical protein